MKIVSVDLADLDLFWFCFFSLRQRHLEDSVLIRGAHLTCVHAGRKRDAAAERANIAFGALSFLAAPAFSLALALIVSVPSCKEMSMSSLRIPGNSTTAITLSLLW